MHSLVHKREWVKKEQVVKISNHLVQILRKEYDSICFPCAKSIVVPKLLKISMNKLPLLQ